MNLTWQDWNGVAGSVLGVVGLWVTWLAYRKAESAREAATEARDATTEFLRKAYAADLWDRFTQQLRELTSGAPQSDPLYIGKAATIRDDGFVLIAELRSMNTGDDALIGKLDEALKQLDECVKKAGVAGSEKDADPKLILPAALNELHSASAKVVAWLRTAQKRERT